MLRKLLNISGCKVIEIISTKGEMYYGKKLKRTCLKGIHVAVLLAIFIPPVRRSIALSGRWYKVKKDIIFFEYSQGVATDSNYWYFTSKYGIVKTDMNFKIIKARHFDIPSELRSKGYDHIGDPDYYRGKLYIPLEGKKRHRHPIVAIYDAKTLKYTGAHYNLNTSIIDAAWIAIDSKNKLAYSSDDITDTIDVYDLAKNFKLIRSIKLNKTLQTTQGGAIYEGYLYVSCDDKNKSIYRINLSNGEVRKIITLNIPGEMEGITFLDVYNAKLHFIFLPPPTFLLPFHIGGNYFYHYTLRR